MTPLNEGSRLTPDASSITSDGGEANLIILAEQPGDDARAGTVSTQAPAASEHTGSERHLSSSDIDDRAVGAPGFYVDHRLGRRRSVTCTPRATARFE